MLKRIIQDVRTLALGAGAGQLITLLVTPIVTRIYSPNDFGLVQVFMIGVMLAMPFSHLSLHIGIPIARTDLQVRALFLLSCAILLINCSFLFILGYSVNSSFFPSSISPITSNWNLFVIAIFVGGLYEILSSYLIKTHNFILVSTNSIYQSLTNSVSKVILGVIVPGGDSLILSSIFSTVVGICRSSRAVYRSIAITKTDFLCKFLFREFINSSKFAVLYAPSAFLGSLTLWFPIFSASVLYGEDTAGHFTLAFTVLVLPMSLIGNSLHQSFYSRLVQLVSSPELDVKKMIWQMQIFLSAISVPIILLLGFWGEDLFIFVFGSAWAPAGTYTVYLGALTMISLSTSPFSKALLLFCSKQKSFLLITLVRLLFSIILVVIASSLKIEPLTFLAAFVAYSIFLNCAEYLISLSVLNKYRF